MIKKISKQRKVFKQRKSKDLRNKSETALLTEDQLAAENKMFADFCCLLREKKWIDKKEKLDRYRQLMCEKELEGLQDIMNSQLIQNLDPDYGIDEESLETKKG